jgi:hypothetical protein
MQRRSTVRDGETKQVEFVRAAGAKAQQIYVYDGASQDWRTRWSYHHPNYEPSYGTQSYPKVWVMREFKNSAANGLGFALPKGRLRFYRRDTDGQLEFLGENTIDHTPATETVRVYTGNAFDLVGERKRTAYNVETAYRFDETYEIRLRNHKKEAVEIRVVEHLFRGPNWQIIAESNKFTKLDSNTIETRALVPPEGEKVITYSVRYVSYSKQ